MAIYLDNTQPVIMPILGKESGDRWILQGYFNKLELVDDDWSYFFTLDGVSYKLIIPTGFKADGASVPRALRSIVKMGGREMPDEAWLPHDFIYERKGDVRGYLFIYHRVLGEFCPVNDVNRKFTDKMFREELKNPVHGLSSFKAPLAYAGVRVGGGFYWSAK